MSLHEVRAYSNNQMNETYSSRNDSACFFVPFSSVSPLCIVMVMGELGVLRVCFLRVAKCFCFVGLFETTAHSAHDSNKSVASYIVTPHISD
jgi:hypothetical protein